MEAMRIVRGIAGVTALGVAIGMAVAACSKDKTTNPPPSGGTTLNLDLAAGGGVNSATFATAGTFPYKCGIHPTIMRGDTVIVSASSSVTDVNVVVTGTETPGFSPRTVTVKVGGNVHWTNPTTMHHTVVND
jgi:plastocyanin